MQGCEITRKLNSPLNAEGSGGIGDLCRYGGFVVYEKPRLIVRHSAAPSDCSSRGLHRSLHVHYIGSEDTGVQFSLVRSALRFLDLQRHGTTQSASKGF